MYLKIIQQIRIMNYPQTQTQQQQQRVSVASSGQANLHRILKRINSAAQIQNVAISQDMHDDQVTGGVIRDRYPGETDDDELVQKSSIISYQESKHEHGGDNPFSGSRHGGMNKTQKLKFGPQPEKLQNEDVEKMQPKDLQRHLNNLREAIAELYLGIKQKTRDENDVPTPEEEQEERDIIMSLDSYVIIEYIKSSVDIILNLKFEEIEKRLLDKNNEGSRNGGASGTHQESKSPNKNIGDESDRSSVSQQEGPCPKVYEELIQQLEGDIRKHIRIEQQLKLHIESMENRIEELENENEKMEAENSKIKKNHEVEIQAKLKDLEERVKSKDEVVKAQEAAIRGLREAETKFRKEIETLKANIADFNQNQTKVIDPISLINQAIGDVSRSATQEVMNKTQPMIIKQSSINMHSQQAQQTGLQQIKKMSFQNQENNFGSYSSNHSFAEGSSPERRTTTPDITHPYLHQTQLVSRKQSGAPGTGQKAKKFVPNSVVDSIGLQAQFTAINPNYSTSGTSGKVIGQRKLSSQHSRNHQTVKGLPIKAVTQNSWMGQINNTTFPSASVGQPIVAGAPNTQFSNIINNNIQGLSINYSNQIIQNPDSIQSFANNFIMPPTNLPQAKQISSSGVEIPNNGEDSESSNLNSHRRCKSQNVKRNRSENAKSVDRKKGLKNSQNNQYMAQDLSHDILLMQQMNSDPNKFRKNVPLSNQTAVISHMEDTQPFEGTKLGNSFMLNESTRLAHDFLNSEIANRRVIKNQVNSVTQQTLNTSGQSKTRTASNRVQQQNQAVDEFGKNRFNQSYGGGGQSITSNGKVKNASSNSRNANVLFNAHSTNLSIEKSRSRNKKGQLSQNQTVCVAMPSSGSQYATNNNLFDLNFKTTSSTQNQQAKLVSAPSSAVQATMNQTFVVPNKNNSATNTAAFLNQTNIQILKQQILAHKKASNLLMKGLSPLKK